MKSGFLNCTATTQLRSTPPGSRTHWPLQQAFGLCLLLAVSRQRSKDSQETHALNIGKQDLATNVPTLLFWGLCARVVASHTVIALAASPSVGRNLMMFYPDAHWWGQASCPRQKLYPTQMVPSPHRVHIPPCKRQADGWQRCGLRQGGRVHEY